MWNPDEFLAQLYSHHAPIHSFTATTMDEWRVWRSTLKAKLVQAIVLPDREEANLEPEQLERVDCGTYIRERIQMVTGPSLIMPCYVLIPKGGKPPYPAIVACPGHGYGAKQLVGLEPDGSVRKGKPGIYKDFPIALVKQGFVVIVPEVLGLGDRRLLQDQDKPAEVSSCFRLSTNLLMAGKTLLGQRVHEMMICVDYLRAHSDVVASEQIGCMGFSGGGLVLAITAAIDERIHATVISGYTNTYQDSIMAKPHCSDNYIPGILNYAEMPDLFGLIAPRPLLVQSGMGDLGFPIEGTRRAINHLRTIYNVIDKTGLLQEDLHPGKHEVSVDKALDWLHTHLKS